ncbi:Insertion element IS6110 uncharacterized 12.0 kDa protein [Nocardioides aquaticus]|uniref:Insertion element IS6110 uncharacterized 12.0 kDa protein n=1 Tax=Nocardioides aquaticus TaxID=160826 RepID=A0ABX8EKT9_9ACTN|nr:Insertion element IS6110 uncharacterized 12.0 kDa protein [Nocardioides aquaticus]
MSPAGSSGSHVSDVPPGLVTRLSDESKALLGRLDTVPRPYPPEFRHRAVALVRAGKQAKQVAYELGISAGCLHNWVRQDRIDRGELDGVATSESADPPCGSEEDPRARD